MRAVRWPHLALVAVCVLHALLPFLVLGGHVPLGWDETVYVSQIAPHHVAGYFSAPRARGVSLLTAPVSLVTPSLLALRVWLALLSAVGLYAGMRPWLRAVGGWTVPLAAALWSGLWIGIFYGNAAMPNQWVAFAALAATGWFVVVLRDPTRRMAWLWLGVALVIAALMRPSDSLALAVPLVLTALVARRVPWRRRGALLSVIGVSLLAGWAEWIAEALVRFGGVAARLHAASIENGGAGLHWELTAEMRALAGPTLCRYHCLAAAPASYRVWWFALLPLAAAGILLGRRRTVMIRDAVPLVLPAAVGIVLAVEYFVLVGYAAPRFLMPAYALLALPIAEGLKGGVAITPTRARVFAVVAMLIPLTLHEANQVKVARAIGARAASDGSIDSALARFLTAQGVSGSGGHCAVAGDDAGPASYAIDCYGIDTIGWRAMAETLAHRGDRVALVLARRTRPDPFFASWSSATFVDGKVHWTVWLSKGL